MIDIFLVLALIAILALFIAWPKTNIYALALSLPLIGWLFYFKNFIFTFADIVALLTIAAFLIRNFYLYFFQTKIKLQIKYPLLFPFGVFFLISALSAIFSSNPLASIYYIIRWPLITYLAYILIPYNLIKNGKFLKKTIFCVAVSSLIVLASGFLSLYGQDWQNSFFRLSSIAWWGILPFGDNHNLIAEFLNVGAFLLLSMRAWQKDVRLKKILDLLFVLSALGIVITFSRAGWLTLGLQLIIYFGYKFKNKIKEKNNLVLAIILIIIILSPLIWKMNQLQKDNTSSTENRLLLTEISLEAFKGHPILGVGSGNFINLVDDNIRFKAKYGEAIDSHGILQKVMAENGVLGLAAWLFILVYLIKISSQALKKYYSENTWLLPLIIAGGGGLFFQFFNTSYYKGKVWFAIALILIAIRLLEVKYEKKN